MIDLQKKIDLNDDELDAISTCNDEQSIYNKTVNTINVLLNFHKFLSTNFN